MKSGDKFKFVGQSNHIKNGQTGKIVSEFKELPYFGLVSSEKWWEVAFEGHPGTDIFSERDLKKVNEQLTFTFTE